MAYPALATTPPKLVQSVVLQDANGNGWLDVNECADILVTLTNTTSQPLMGVTAVLGSATPGVLVDPAPRMYPDLEPGDRASPAVPFRITTTPLFTCGTNVLFTLTATSTNRGDFAQLLCVNSLFAGPGNPRTSPQPVFRRHP